MADYLVTLSLGPVQSMIGAARRTRDLWCGSWLLSEASRAAAQVFYQNAKGGELIFPAPEDPAWELQPLDKPGDEANISNILRVLVRECDEAQVKRLCAAAKAAAVERLVELGDEARRDLKGLRHEVWQAQINDLLEGFAAWVAIDGDKYAAASSRLGGVQAARKATRDCLPSALAAAGFGLPKSSLDGAFETVLPESPSPTLTRQLGLSKGEQLDALGVIKRHGGDAEQFTAYSRIAADPWLRRLTPEQQQRLCACYEPLVGCGLATRVRGNKGIYNDLPYDGQLLFDFRLDNARSLYKEEHELHSLLDELRNTLRPLAREKGADQARCGMPVPYAVILQADGDRMGELLNCATSAAASRRISSALHGFACNVRPLVRKYRGHAIYAGGDDVLALLPLDQAIACAEALAADFKQRMAGIAGELGLAIEKYPTLSVGLGIGHLLEPLGSLRTRAQRAEKWAKGDHPPAKQQRNACAQQAKKRAKGDYLPVEKRRNALAITLGIRSGGETEWRGRWDDPEALHNLQHFIESYRAGRFSSRIAYDLRSISQRLCWLDDHSDDATTRGMRSAEVYRMLQRTRLAGGDKSLDPKDRDHLLACAAVTTLAELADTLIIARWLAARSRTDLE